MLKMICLFVLFLITIFACIYFSVKYQPREIVINCGIAEISPDFTPAMREACRNRFKGK